MDSAPGLRALRTGRVSLPNHAYLLTTTTRGRAPWFADHANARVACRCIERATEDAGIEPLVWVFMPDHLHLLGVLQRERSLSAAISQIKATIARAVNRARGGSGPLWARAYHDHAMRREEDVLATARYVVANPVRAGLVRSPSEYPYWNSIWLP